MPDGSFEDGDGINWDSVADWFFVGVVGGCGCGISEEIAEMAIELLTMFGKKESAYNLCDSNVGFEILAHWFDHKELTEHGTVITSSWLTEKGELVWNIINEHRT